MFRKFAKVILPLSLPQLFTYAIPETFQNLCFVGSRVVVPFGKSKLYSAVVYSVDDTAEGDFEIKEILEVLDSKPIINAIQLKFWDWIASYYMCSVGEVYRAAVPAMLKLESQTLLFRTAKPLDFNELKPKEVQLLGAFTPSLTELELSKVGKYTGLKNNISLVKNLIFNGYLVADKVIQEKFRPKTEKFLSLNKNLFHSEKQIITLLDELSKRAPKQAEILYYYFSQSGFLAEDSKIVSFGEIDKKRFSDSKFSSSSLNSLIDKQILLEEEREVSRLSMYEGDLELYHELTETQKNALEKIESSFLEKNAALLFGVTGSGKTEIYIRLIDKYLSLGKQVLYLLPEIVLTSQIIRRLQKVFGSKVGIYHSKISDYERSEIWQNLVDKDNLSSYKLIVGVRSSIFLPFSDLGLIIVDEEHESSYKQADPQPRYNARDCALVLAGFHSAKVLLGSATPSFETYFNATTGKYSLVELSSRYADFKLPEIEIVNTRTAQKRGQMKSLFYDGLIKRIEKNIAEKKQTILYRNRRGFSPYVECSSCGWIPVCENCDVTLTYHKRENRLVCHHCGYVTDMPKKCSACNDSVLITKGFGTEKVEDEIKIFFPEAKISRLDADITTSRSKFEQVIYDFENGSTDILTGTQMISKGFDFKRLTLCGILDADTMLFFPDFRAEEKTFQQLTQVSGRVGRHLEGSRVVIQTSNPENEIFKDVVSHNYKNMYARLIAERNRFAYPPYTRLIKIQIKHKDEAEMSRCAMMLASNLRKVFSSGVMGPEFPLVSRIQNLYIKEIMLKISRKHYGQQAKKIILDAVNYTKSMALKAGLIISINVDPL
ncbi:MAG: primosomal protein N' [Bacteroidales bacterium]|nr:primosomal protein N' [Bacteroidales bacterium]